MHRTLAIALLMLTVPLVGCIGGDDLDQQSVDDALDAKEITRVQERSELGFTIDEGPSHTLVEGPYEILDGFGVRVDVELPATEGGGAPTGSAEVHMGLFLPKIPGCDWESFGITTIGEISGVEDLEMTVPEHCKVPVVADAGPYYRSSQDHSPLLGGSDGVQLEGDSVATEPAARLGGFLIEELVPHGFAVAQVSVYGTGDSGHCMDLMGESEQAGIVGAVDFLGEAPFSNGHVGLIGRSYDGTTPWEAASHTPEALKTIVPISGLTGLRDLMWRNGSAELRGGTGLLWGLYYTFALDASPEDAEHLLCPDAQQGLAQSLGAYATGGDMGPADAAYWEERSHFATKAIENGYDGSVYLIHGFQDWNVDPHMAFPIWEELHEAGIETKALIGQWDHAYPDRRSDHEDLGPGYGEEAFPATVRHDWAQDLLEWFGYYLNGSYEQPQLHAEIQDNRGYWRIEQHYPPEDAEPVKIEGGDMTFENENGSTVAPGRCALIGLATLSEDGATNIVGMPTFHVQATPTGPGGQLFARLWDATDELRLGHAVMDLRYANGGETMEPVTPGQPLTAKMQFLALDVVVPAGHELELEVCTTGEDYMEPSTTNPILLDLSGTTLTLPTVQRGADAYFLPPGQGDVLGDGVPSWAAP